MIIYYSWTGKTKTYAGLFAEKLGLPLFRLEEKNARKGKIDFAKGVAQSIFKSKTELKEMPDFAASDILYIAAPVWASGFPPAINTFLEQADVKGKTIHVIMTCGGSSAGEVQKRTAVQIEKHGAKAGEFYLFACAMKQPIDLEIAKEHVEEALHS